MNDLEQNVRDIEEELRLLADSDLPCSWIAQQLLESYGMDSSSSPKESTEPTIGTDNEPQNPPEPKGSVFAY